MRRRARKKTPKEKKQQLSYFSSPRQQALDMKLFLNTNYTTFNRKHVVAIVLAFVFIFTPVITVLALTDQERAVLEAELKVLEAEIAEKEKLLSQQKQQTGSISRDVSILTNQIEQAKLSIKAKNLQINKISEEIGNKEEVIETLDEKIEREKESLAQLLRKTNEINDTSLIHIILSNESLSEFYVDLDSFQSIKEDIRASVAEIEQVQGITAEEKKALEDKKNAEMDTKASLEDSKKKVELNEQEKKRLLSVSKGKESEYQTVLADRQKRAAAIRSALFQLRDSGAIPFGDALAYAESAQKKTGVRPAIVLAVLEQESNYGANVGSCYLKDPITGAGVGKNTGTPFSNVMKPSRDVTPFLAITKKLGIDPYTTPVSCPLSIGYGGALGLAQFIPSTWTIFENRIAAAVGVSPVSPWIPEHGIMASSMYLGDLGAGKGGYTAELNAACRYYGGGTACTSITTTYGTQVMTRAARIQANIDILHSF
mgnify:CR=1 FL=1